jgi:hypothetical protein
VLGRSAWWFWGGVAGGDLDVAEIYSSVEHGGDIGMAEHVGMHPRTGDAGRVCQVAEAASGAVPVHPVPTPVEQEWAAAAVPGRTFDGPCDGRRKGCQDVPVALAAHQQHAVAVLFSQIFDVGSGGLEDPQPE